MPTIRGECLGWGELEGRVPSGCLRGEELCRELDERRAARIGASLRASLSAVRRGSAGCGEGEVPWELEGRVLGLCPVLGLG
jgi:hypothetical protein